MDNISESNSKLSYEELLEQNIQLKNQVQEIKEKPKKELNRYNKTDFYKVDLGNNIDFHDIFDINEIQRIQDLFAEATGVASIITYPNGIPITKPSNFCRLCFDIIRKTKKGLKNCYNSDAEIGKQNIGGAITQRCLSGGLWDGGASITVGGKHIANWLIGQVKDEKFDENKMLLYAKEIGADETEFKKALDEVSVMSTEKFKKIGDTLFFFANEISQKAYQSTFQNRLITELQEKEEQLIKAKEIAEGNELKFKALYDNSPDMYVSVSPDTSEIIICNDTFLNKTGYSREEIIGTSVFKVYHPDSLEKATNIFKLFKETGSINNEELILAKKSGEKIHVSLNVTSIRDNQGRTLYSLSSWRDITQRIKLREEQYRDQQLLNETGRLARIGGWELDISTMTSYYSKETKRIFGLVSNAEPPKEFEGMKYFPKEAREKLEKLLQNAIENGKPYDVEVPVINEQGKRLWVRTIGLAETKDGKVTRLYGTLQDITEKKQHEKELIKAKEKAEESDRLKSAFLSNMSHEIRTPMNGILGFTTLLQEADLSVKNQKNYIDIIQKSGDRLLNTVNDIIEISKIESGEIKVTKSEVDIIGHLNTQVAFFRPEAEKKNIDIIVENSIDGNDLSIITDETKLSSILSNLIKNATKYTNGGTIIVGFKIENRQIQFSCQDTGIGIPKNRQDAIFNRFEQADIEDKQVHQGSGLGLAIVKSYVEILDGKIWVESEEGQGSTFYVSLPCEHEKKKEQIIPQEAISLDSGIKNIKVLIVEDDEISSMHLSAVMEGKVKNISTAQNGIEAIDACKNNSGIDLILMDINMPVMGGIEATKKIREFNKDIVIISQTAYALQGDKEKALDAGCNDYISKPIKKDKLFELINKYF